MVAINKDESMKIRKRFPNAHIVRTMKQKSKRHHYFVEETRRVMAYLNQLRDGKGGANAASAPRRRVAPRVSQATPAWQARRQNAQ